MDSYSKNIGIIDKDNIDLEKLFFQPVSWFLQLEKG